MTITVLDLDDLARRSLALIDAEPVRDDEGRRYVSGTLPGCAWLKVDQLELHSAIVKSLNDMVRAGIPVGDLPSLKGLESGYAENDRMRLRVIAQYSLPLDETAFRWDIRLREEMPLIERNIP